MTANLSSLLLELEAWDTATSEDRLLCAAAILKTLPSEFTFQGLARKVLGEQSHEIAFFTYDGCTFGVLPGQSDAVLGYDRSRPFVPNSRQIDDWQIVYDEFECSIAEYLDEILSPFRRVRIHPLLVEVVPRRFEYAQDGSDQTVGYKRIREQLGEGFRLPTPDEWEYICAGGSTGLFRWGNDCPVSNSYQDQSFSLHKQPNAFGIMLNSSTYDSELCCGPQLRGGDGGGAVHGGIGKLTTWFPLASSFQISDEEVEGWWIDDVFARRVRTIALTAST